MIVVDTNILIYLYLPGPQTELCNELLAHDPDWASPTIWRSEFCNTLLLYLRKDLITPAVAIQIVAAAEDLIGGNALKPTPSDVMQLALDSRCTFYDCEFVAAAKSLATILVTEDKALLKAFPDEAFSLSNAMKRR